MVDVVDVEVVDVEDVVVEDEVLVAPAALVVLVGGRDRS